MSSFGLRQLKAMGWNEGKGLGLEENGIKTAIKPKLKFDNKGIGFEGNESNQWWNQSFNCSANFIDFKLTQTQNGIKLKHKTSDKQKEKKKYSNFVKSCETEKQNEEIICSDPKICSTLDFDEVFRKSGRRTAHKAGRHGITMSAKLKRIEEQNNEFLKKYKKLKSNE